MFRKFLALSLGAAGIAGVISCKAPDVIENASYEDKYEVDYNTNWNELILKWFNENYKDNINTGVKISDIKVDESIAIVFATIDYIEWQHNGIGYNKIPKQIKVGLDINSL